MKLDKLAVTRNSYNFESDGIPAQSYGGKVVFKDDADNLTQINISPAGIDQIMQVVALEVSNNAKKMLAAMSLEAVRDSARPLAIIVDKDIEEAQFTEVDHDRIPF
jgi:hypothetical protein